MYEREMEVQAGDLVGVLFFFLIEMLTPMYIDENILEVSVDREEIQG